MISNLLNDTRHFDSNPGYPSYEEARQVLDAALKQFRPDILPLSVIAAKPNGTFVPVAILHEDNMDLARPLAERGVYVTNIVGLSR